MAYRHIQLPLAWTAESEADRQARLLRLDALDGLLLLTEEVNLLSGPDAPLHPWLRDQYRSAGGRWRVGNGATLHEALLALQEPLMRQPVPHPDNRVRPELQAILSAG